VARPVFLSYTWNQPDKDEVDQLDLAMRLRGVPVWRDRRDMTFGTYNEPRVRQGIETECSGFALYYSDAVLASEFILRIELDAMDSRRRRGAPPPFFAGAILRRSMPFSEAAEELHTASHVRLGEALGTHVSLEDLSADLRAAANAVLSTYVEQNLTGEEVTLRVETRGEVPNSDPALLHLSWCPPLTHDPELHPDDAWSAHLLPAIADLRAGLEKNAAPRRLRIGGNLHLSAAFALGWEFRQPTRWSVALDHDFVPCETAMTEGDPHGWRIVPNPGPPDGDERLVVCLHASKDVAMAMERHSRELPPARVTLHVYPPSGNPGRTSLDSNHANDLAAAIAAAINDCRSTYGTRQTHLYLACPWPLATLLAWHLSSSGRLVMHEPDVDRDSYRSSCELT
jgi:hypothetical protein